MGKKESARYTLRWDRPRPQRAFWVILSASLSATALSTCTSSSWFLLCLFLQLVIFRVSLAIVLVRPFGPFPEGV